MAKTVGSIRKVMLDGVTFTAAADADLTHTLGAYDVEAIATGGENVRKVTKRVESVEAELLATGPELKTLKDFSERMDDFPMCFCEASGDTYRSKGFIKLDTRSTAEGKIKVTMYPRSGGWEQFLA